MPRSRTAHAAALIVPGPAFDPRALRTLLRGDPFKYLTGAVEHAEGAGTQWIPADLNCVERACIVAVQVFCMEPITPGKLMSLCAAHGFLPLRLRWQAPGMSGLAA